MGDVGSGTQYLCSQSCPSCCTRVTQTVGDCTALEIKVKKC